MQNEIYTPHQEVGILKRVAAATITVGALAAGTTVASTGVAVNEYFTKPSILASDISAANARSQYENYLQTLGPDCRVAVESTTGTIDLRDPTFPACHPEKGGHEVVNNYVNRYRNTIFWAETGKWWAGLAPIGAGSLVAVAIGGALVLRRKLGYATHDLIPVKIASGLLYKKRLNIEERDAQWRIANQQWLPLTSEAKLQEEPKT